MRLSEANAPTAEPEPEQAPSPPMDKPRFEVAPNKGGLAPGVTPENLKDVILEMEGQEFLEKLGL